MTATVFCPRRPLRTSILAIRRSPDPSIDRPRTSRAARRTAAARRARVGALRDRIAHPPADIAPDPQVHSADAEDLTR